MMVKGKGDRMRILRDRFMAVVIILISFLFTGCVLLPGGYAQSVSGHLGSRRLSATVAGARDLSLRTDPRRNSGIVAFDRHELVFEGDSVLLDGEQVTKLAPKSKEVNVRYKNGVLTIDDGVSRVEITKL
jgi:hypothetical protein